MRTQVETLNDLLLARGGTASLEVFAAQLRISVRALHDLRMGKVGKPRRATVYAIAQALKVSQERVRAAIQASREARDLG